MQSTAIGRTTKWIGAGLGLAAAGYAALVGRAWYRYGKRQPPRGRFEMDGLLDEVMPDYEVVERHAIRIAAPADIAMDAAAAVDLRQSAVARTIFNVRAFVLGARDTTEAQAAGLVAQMKSLGWSILAEIPGREVVFGAVTRPREADVVF